MRGKNLDKEFVFSFIKECAMLGKSSPEEICQEVLDRTAKIDEQLKLRIKLQDVLGFFEYNKKKFY